MTAVEKGACCDHNIYSMYLRGDLLLEICTFQQLLVVHTAGLHRNAPDMNITCMRAV